MLKARVGHKKEPTTTTTTIKMGLLFAKLWSFFGNEGKQAKQLRRSRMNHKFSLDSYFSLSSLSEAAPIASYFWRWVEWNACNVRSQPASRSSTHPHAHTHTTQVVSWWPRTCICIFIRKHLIHSHTHTQQLVIICARYFSIIITCCCCCCCYTSEAPPPRAGYMNEWARARTHTAYMHSLSNLFAISL